MVKVTKCLSVLWLLFLLPGCLHKSFAQSWQWGRYCPEIGSFESWPVATDALGNVYGGGTIDDPGGLTYTFGSVSVPGYITGNGQSMWVKYDASGTPLWADGTVSGITELDNMVVDPSGNLILFGAFYTPNMQIGSFTLTNTSGTANNFFLAKVSPSGTVLWAINDGSMGISGAYQNEARGKVTTDAAGNIYIASSFDGNSMTIGTHTLTNTGSSTTYDIYVAKYTTSGTLSWVTQLGGTGDDYPSGITISATGYIYISGSFTSPSMSVGSSTIYNPNIAPPGILVANSYAFIAKLTTAGVPLWAQAAGGSNGAYASAIAKDNSGNVYMIGGFLDASVSFGSVTLTRPYPSSVPDRDLFLIQYSSSDVAAWGKTIGCPPSPPHTVNLVCAYSVTTYCNQVWLDAAYSEKAVIGNTDTIGLNTGPDPLLIAGFNSSGGIIGYSSLPTGGDDEAEIAADPSGNLFLCGDYCAADAPAAHATVIGPDTFQSFYGGYYFIGAENELFFMAKYDNSIADTLHSHIDTTVCNDSGITLSAPAGYLAYKWSTGDTTLTLKIKTADTYYVYSMGCGVSLDTFNVFLSPADTSYHQKTTALCSSVDSLTLTGPAGYPKYTWSSGDSTPAIVVKIQGSYYVVASSACGMEVDTFNVIQASSPTLYLGNDTIFCNSNPITLSSAQPAGTSYLWSTGSQDNSIVVSGAGEWWLKVTNRFGCSAVDTAHVFVHAQSQTGQIANVTRDATIAYGASIQLNADSVRFYYWKPDDGSLNNANINNPVATPERTTIYTVYGFDQHGCLDSASLTIVVDSTMSECIPSAFTPNGDGLNDMFRPACIAFQNLVDFRIYNRWGQQIFYSNSAKVGWDGTFNGVPQDMGTYFYLISVARPNQGMRIYKGDVTLIR
jgi:gliding motility-associated-like protein